MQSWLSVEQNIITCLEMTVDYLVLMVVPKIASMRDPLFLVQHLKFDHFAVLLD